MADRKAKKKSQVQADNNSVATGDVSIGGGVAGDFHIGNSYELSKEEYTRLFNEMLSKVEKKDSLENVHTRDWISSKSLMRICSSDGEEFGG